MLKKAAGLFVRKGSEKETYKPPAIPNAPPQTNSTVPPSLSAVRSPEEELWFSDNAGGPPSHSHPQQDGKAPTTSAAAASMGGADLFASMNVVASGSVGRNTAPHPEQNEPVNIYGHQHVPQSSSSASAFSFISSNSSGHAQDNDPHEHDSKNEGGMTSSFSFITAAASGPSDPPLPHNTAPPTPETTSAFSFVSASATPSQTPTAAPPSPRSLPPKYTPNGGGVHHSEPPVAQTSAAIIDNKQTIVHKPVSASPVALPGMYVAYFIIPNCVGMKSDRAEIFLWLHLHRLCNCDALVICIHVI
jgi:hypothetical protein